MTKTKKAFTIVELLVVMAVIGVLVTLAVVGIQAIQRSQRETTRLNDIRNLDAKLAEYYTKYRHYPFLDINDAPRSDIKYDNLGSETGVCLFVPALGEANDCDVSINASYKFANIIMSPGFWGSGEGSFAPFTTIGDYDSYVCSANTQDPNYYEVQFTTRYTSTPQEYMLFGCLESGKTQNFGSLANDN